MDPKKWWILLGVVLISLGLHSCSDEDGEEEGPTDEIHYPWLSSEGQVSDQVSQIRLKALFGQSLHWEQSADLLFTLGYGDCTNLPANMKFRVREGMRSYLVRFSTPDQVYRNGFRHLFIDEENSPTLFLEMDCQEQSVVSY